MVCKRKLVRPNFSSLIRIQREAFIKKGKVAKSVLTALCKELGAEYKTRWDNSRLIQSLKDKGNFSNDEEVFQMSFDRNPPRKVKKIQEEERLWPKFEADILHEMETHVVEDATFRVEKVTNNPAVGIKLVEVSEYKIVSVNKDSFYAIIQRKYKNRYCEENLIGCDEISIYKVKQQFTPDFKNYQKGLPWKVGKQFVKLLW